MRLKRTFMFLNARRRCFNRTCRLSASVAFHWFTQIGDSWRQSHSGAPSVTLCLTHTQTHRSTPGYSEVPRGQPRQRHLWGMRRQERLAVIIGETFSCHTGTIPCLQQVVLVLVHLSRVAWRTTSAHLKSRLMVWNTALMFWFRVCFCFLFWLDCLPPHHPPTESSKPARSNGPTATILDPGTLFSYFKLSCLYSKPCCLLQRHTDVTCYALNLIWELFKESVCLKQSPLLSCSLRLRLRDSVDFPAHIPGCSSWKYKGFEYAFVTSLSALSFCLTRRLQPCWHLWKWIELRIRGFVTNPICHLPKWSQILDYSLCESCGRMTSNSGAEAFHRCCFPFFSLFLHCAPVVSLLA